MKKIPVCEPALLGNEIAYVADAIKTTWISSAGTYLERFEKGFGRYLGRKYAVATTNGTTALHIALAACGIKKGDEVIIPDFTMISPVFAICYVGALPVFVDVDPHTWTIDPDQIEKKITKKTKAILAVHIYGHPADMKAILHIAKKNKLLVIEDAAEAHGATCNGKKCGSLSDIAAFSFYANKIITTGEGGMVVTDDERLASKAKSYKNLCFPMKGARTFLHEDIGFNYRMTNIQAAIGLAQLENIERLVEARRKNAALYNKLLKEIPGVTLPREMKWAKNVYWMYSIIIENEFGKSRDELMTFLKQKGVDTRTFFIPMHVQPAFRNMGLFEGERYPVSERLGERGLYLPSGSGLTAEQIQTVCAAMKEASKLSG